MKKNTSWKFTDELSVTFQLSVSGAGEFGLYVNNAIQLLSFCLRSNTFAQHLWLASLATRAVQKYYFSRKKKVIIYCILSTSTLMQIK